MAPSLGDQLPNQCCRLLRPLPGPPPGGELTHERPRPMADLDKPLSLELTIGLDHGSGVDAELGRELTHGWERGSSPERTRGDREPHTLGDLSIQWSGTAGVDAVEQTHLTVSLCWYTITLDRRGDKL